MNSYLRDPPDAFTEIVNLWKEIKVEFFDDGTNTEANSYEDALSTGAWCWEPIFSRCSPAEIDRLGEVMLGPFFSSEEYPWPESNGQPMIPLIQIDLDNASKIGGVNVGSGLLQVFAKVEDKYGKNIYTREIERGAVLREKIHPVPEFSDEIDGFASVAWAQSELAVDKFYTDRLCIQISGYTEKRFSLWTYTPFSDEYDLESIHSNLKSKMERFDSLVAKYSEEWTPDGFHLFGAFRPIQYYPKERSRPFFCLESEYGLNFGDGQAQIFYETGKEYGTLFYFDWSCY